MTDENKYWECKICGKVYQTYPWEQCPEPKCELLCNIYANGNGFRSHSWYQIDFFRYRERSEAQGSSAFATAMMDGCRESLHIITGSKKRKWEYVYEQAKEEAREFGRRRYAKIAEYERKKAAQREQERFNRMSPQEKAAYLKEKEREYARYKRQLFWRNNKKRIIFAMALVVVSVIIFIKFHFESANIDIANGKLSEDKTIATVAYDADVVKDFNHAVFECGDYRKISGDGFMVHVIDRKGMTVTYANKQVTLPYDARKPLARNAMYVWSADDSKGFYVKPTMEGYQVYTYKTPGEMVNDKMSLYSAYSCGSFINNTRYQFLHKEHVSKSFTDLFDTADLKLVRNSIFASHGFVFKSDDVTNYFRKYPWYHPGNNNLDDYTQIEKDNAKFIKKIEDGRNKK